jgi:hypothetical protein
LWLRVVLREVVAQVVGAVQVDLELVKVYLLPQVMITRLLLAAVELL